MPTINETAAKLQANLPTLAARDQDFARSLLSAHAARRLTNRQAYWIEKLAERATTPPPKPVSLNLSPIVALFTNATARGLKRPAIRFSCDNGAKVRISLAGPRSRNAGALYVTDGRPFGENTYYGRVQAGVFIPTQAGEAIVPTLQAIAAAPVAKLAAIGRQSGDCCFCSRELTDSRSVSAGYGPVCADRWGLPWGV